MLCECGLELQGSEIETRVSQPGEPHYEFTRATVLESLPALLAAGVMDDANIERLESYFGQPGTIISVLAAWGKRQVASARA